MQKNNFQQLLHEEERSIGDRGHRQINKIEGGILQSLTLFRFIGDIFTMYLPQFARTVIGGTDEFQDRDVDSYDSNTPNQNISEPKGPSQLGRDNLEQRI